MELSDYRARIDQIDRQLVELFAQRMNTAAGIAAYKKEHGLPVLDPVREREKLLDVAAQAPEDMRDYTASLYTMLFELSRCYQGRLLGSTSPLTTEIQTAISGRVVTNEFAPIINTFLREHLFYDIFARDVLTWQQRELATVGALAGIGNVNPQLTSHFRAAMNTGLTPEQLQEAVDVLNETVSTDTGSNAQAVLNNVLK